MSTDITLNGDVMFAPKVQDNVNTEPSSAAPSVIRTQAATNSHNTFRPDIYRVSEGYVS